MSSLQMICDYSSDSESDREECQQEVEVKAAGSTNSNVKISKVIRDIVNGLIRKVEKQLPASNFTQYRNQTLIDSESDSDTSDLSSWYTESECDDYDDNDDDEVAKTPKRLPRACVTKGELTHKDLPKIEKLFISIPVDDLTQLGTVSSIIDSLVVIESFNTNPPLDIDTVLFSRDGTALGQVFDVIGQVRSPNYILRFNSAEEIKELKVEIGSPVYYTCKLLYQNESQPVTKFVFVADLIKQRGSDASWKYNNEPPPEFLDYSDDEAERIAKWKQNAKQRRK